MSRPEFITTEDVTRWSENIDNDKSIPPTLSKVPVIREVCFAGLWLSEQLDILECPKSLIVRIQFTAGKASFGRDIWKVHQQFLEDYESNTLNFSIDSVNLN